MNKFKRIMALFLAVCMVLGVVPMQASAATKPEKPADTKVTGQPFDTNVSTNHRIPGLVTLTDGTLVATADARWDTEHDGGGMDVVVSTLAPGEDEWSYTYAAYLGDNGNKHSKDSSTLMDPVIITDGTELYLLSDLFPAGLSIGGGDNTTTSFADARTTGNGFYDENSVLIGTGDGQYNYYLDSGKIYTSDGSEVSDYTVDGWFNLYQGEGENKTYVSNLFFADSPYKIYPTSYIALQTYDKVNKEWSAPELLNIKTENSLWTVLGPGSGLVTKDNKLAFTTYDANDGITLVYGTSADGWKTVRTTAAKNESSIVELSDGTIRAFVKRQGNNKIAYVDFSKNDSGYAAGNLVETNAANFSNCMVSSLKYSKTIDGKEVILVCCPSLSSGGNFAGRFNGKIYVFTVNANKDMELEGSYQINGKNGNNEFFAYSNMTERADGSIDLLYEDSCISYSAGNYAGGKSHITYTNVNLVDELDITFDEKISKNVELSVGEVWSETVKKTIAPGTHISDAADVVWTNKEIIVQVPSAQLGTSASFDGAKIDLNDCLYTFSKNADDTWVISKKVGNTWIYVNPYNTAKYPNKTSAANVTITESGYTGATDGAFIFKGKDNNNKEGSLHFHTQDGTYYWNQCGSAHAENNNGTHGIFVLTLNEDGTLTEVTTLNNLKSGSQYLIAGKDGDGVYYVMYPTTSTSNLYAQVAKHVGMQDSVTTATEITVTGKAVGTTSVEVGLTQYNITVEKNYNKETVELKPGESKTYTDNTGYYSNGTIEDSSVAEMEISGSEEIRVKELKKVTDLESGKQYLISSKRAGKLLTNESYTSGAATWIGTITGLSMTGSSSVDSTELWTITASGNGYTVVQDNKYLTFANNSAAMTDTETVLTFTYDAANERWTIKNGGYYLSDLAGDTLEGAFGYSSANDDGNYWEVYEIVEKIDTAAYTNVTFTGVSVGTTTALIGSTKYTITVKDEKTVELYVDESKTIKVEDVNYSETDVTLQPDTSIARIDSIESQTVTVSDADLLPVTTNTGFDGTKKYLLVSERSETNGMLTGNSYNATISWSGLKIEGLNTNGTVSADSTEVWTIKPADTADKYYVMYGDRYLTFSHGSPSTASLTDTPTPLSLSYTNDWWYITNESGHYLSNVGGFGSNYFGASGFNEQGGSGWWIKEVVPAETETYTNITFTGVAEGNTLARIGATDYKIVVKPNLKQTIELYVGQSKTVRDESGRYENGTIVDETIATMKVVDGVTEAVLNVSATPATVLESGKSYLICLDGMSRAVTSNPTTAIWAESHLAIEESNFVANNVNVWTLEASGNGYKIKSSAGTYLSLGTENNYATLGADGEKFNFIWDSATNAWTIGTDNNKYFNDLDGTGSGNHGHLGGYTQGDTKFDLYEVTTTDPVGYTDITFTGVKAGETSAEVGYVDYTVIVKELSEGNIDGFNNIVGKGLYSDDNATVANRSELDMTGKVIKVLTISEDASFQLDVDITDYDAIEWIIGDDTVATVDANGLVTGVNAGNTIAMAKVTKNGVSEVISIPVNVKESLVAEGVEATSFFYFVENVENTTPYYTMYLSTEDSSNAVYKMVPAAEGEVIYLHRPRASAVGLVWTAAPDANHALVYMASTGSNGQYYPLKNLDGELGSGTVDGVEYYKGNNAYNNIISRGRTDSAEWGADLDATLTTAITAGYKCDGAMSVSRSKTDGTPKFVSSVSFISNPLMEITKTINGVLPTTRKMADFRRYQPGMVAAVAETVYFQIDITLKRPLAWAQDSTTRSAVTYDAATLIDKALGNKNILYFYTKDLDNLDDVWDGVVSNDYRVQEQDITDQLNAEWAEGEDEKVFTYYVLYEIQPDDIPKMQINNVAETNFEYSSAYSTGNFAGAAEANASISVVGKAMDKVVTDFAQRVTLTDLSDTYLKDVYTGENAKYNAQYGTVEVNKEADGEYTVIYTPTKIMQSQDAVVLYGKVNEGQEDEVEKVINGFTIYPATTMYYEEGFMFNENSKNWSIDKAAKATKDQELEYLGKSQLDANGTMLGYSSDKKFNYGYDPMYNLETGYSAGSYATTNVMGAKTTFDITGTGFEIYADCTADTGYVSVQVKDSNNSTVKFLMVNTAALSGTEAGTAGQNDNTYGTPIVSMQNLPYGTYTISVSKIMDEKDVYLDGLRVFNTVEDSSVFAVDGESEPQFVEIRDMILEEVSVDLTGYTEKNGNVPGQVYAGLGGLKGAVVLGNKTQYTDAAMKDLLENGTKNELYLYPGQALTFTLSSGLHAQIGMHAPMGSTSYSLDGGTNTKSVSSTTNMFYEVVGGEVVITNTGDKVLSLTLLKLPGGHAVAPIFDEIGEKNVDAAALSLSRFEAGAYDEVQEEKMDVTEVFGDIQNDWYTEKVQYVFNENIMKGIGGTNFFGPNDNITKAQAAQVLYNIEGNPYVYSESVYEELKDVYKDCWYSDAVAWAYAAGVIKGSSATMEFNPDANITREQFALMMYRYAQYKHYDTTKAEELVGLENADAVSEWAVDGMKWAVGNGIITGVSKNGVKDLAPQDNVTRAQAATMAQRFCMGNDI